MTILPRIKVSANQLYFASIALMVIALPTSIFLISIAQFIMAAAWILQKKYKESAINFLNSSGALNISLIFVLHTLGLFYTTNWQYASNDLRIKLPILIIPFLMAGFEKIEKHKFLLLLKLFVLSTLASTIVSVFILLGFSKIVVTDVRQISILVSHIRLSLMICLSIFVVCYLLRYGNLKLSTKLLFYLLIIWFVAYLFVSESGTGILILFIISILALLFVLIKKMNLKLIVLSAIVLTLSIIFSVATIKNMYLKYAYVHPINFNSLEKRTVNMSIYEHNYNQTSIENGYYVGIYQSWHECKKEWNKRSKIDADGKDMKGQEIRYTMMRYITSKGFRKDSIGISKLTNKDISNIEKGVTNYKFTNSGVLRRLNDIFYEYQLFKANGNASGHSVYMRIQFWKTAITIISKHPLFGVGEGDINDAFLNQYTTDNSNLEKKYWLRAHNQFLNIAVAFGLLGLVAFLFFMFNILKSNNNILLLIFMTILLISFFNEDTLETSTGAVFFAFFASFFSLNFLNNTK